MKKFHFPFQRVMDWRDKRAEQERMELARLRSTGSMLARKREELAEQMRSTSSALAGSSRMSGSDLRQAAAFLVALQSGEREVQSQQAACATAIETQLKKCIEAERDHRLLEKLREQRLAEWQTGYEREAEQTAEEAWSSGRARAAASDSIRNS